MKSDIIITTWNCSECAKLKSLINSDAIYDDEFIGKNGQYLTLINAFSNIGTRIILEKFDFPDNAVTPVLFTYDSSLFWEIEDIINYLKEQGFLNA